MTAVAIDGGGEIEVDTVLAGADTQPLVEGRSEEARSRNRRIELKLTLR